MPTPPRPPKKLLTTPKKTGRPSKARIALGQLDQQILIAIQGSPYAIGAKDVAALIFPGVPWTRCLSESRLWDELGGFLSTRAWLIWWRCQRLVNQGLLARTMRAETDTFAKV